MNEGESDYTLDYMFYRDAFLLLIKQGKTNAEALAEFNDTAWKKALFEELELRGKRAFEDPDSLLSLTGKAGRESMNIRDMDDAIELWMAGWTSETPSSTQQDIYSWYWRRPPKGNRSKGRLFLSTQQALNALRKPSTPQPLNSSTI